MDKPKPIMQAHNVVKDYGVGQNRTRVLHGIDLTICPGELVALIGPSGSGKSTLLNIMGLLDRPTSGVLCVDGVDISTLDGTGLTALRGDKLGFIFQFHHLLPAFSALENVMLPLMAKNGRHAPWMTKHALELLDRVGLADLAYRKATDISGGQQQRVAVARALAGKPSLILADEPTGNLDTETSTEVFDLLRSTNTDLGTALLVVTHDPSIARRCNRTIELVDGRVSADSRASDYQCGGCGMPCPYIEDSPSTRNINRP